jgi:electron transport complex protein RnfE
MGLAKEFGKGFTTELPPFRLVLGLCPTLAVTTKASYGLGMGLAVVFVLTFSNVLVSALRKYIPNKVRIACFIVMIATFVVVVELLMQAFAYPLYIALGIFVPLIVVNCIILGRAEAFASKNGVLYSAADGLGIGLGYTLALIALGGVREILGAGTFFDMRVFGPGFAPFTFLVKAPGAFVSLGIMLFLMNVYMGLKRRKA